MSKGNEAKRIARCIAERFIARGQVWGNYTLDLTLESMLEMDAVVGKKEYLPYVLWIMEKRNRPPEAVVPWESQPFCHINYKLYELTRDPGYIKPFVDETARYRREVGRSPEGAITHLHEYPGRHLLIDMLQDYAARMARAGSLSSDESYFTECVKQYRIYRKLLRSSETGLWCMGRGWLDNPMELSPGAWSRGHGWLIRGMVDSLCSLPGDSEYYHEMQDYLRELADALLKVQDSNGMWRQLLHLPFEESYPDSTGTGFICHNLAKAYHKGFLLDEKYRLASLSAFESLKKSVTDDGIVMDACPGPGPLKSIDAYVRTPGLREDAQGHGPATIIFACAGHLL